MTLIGLHTTDYETALKAWIISKEGSKTSVLKVYTDGVGVPTIGVGYALMSHGDTWTTDFATAGITTTAIQQTALQKLISDSKEILDTSLTTAQKEAQVKALVLTYNSSTNAIILSSTQVGELFLAIKYKYEDIIKSKLGTALYNSLANTKELVALVDLAYNGGNDMIGDKLVNALKNNDRAEAWFEIRYNSNAGNSYNTVGTGLAERRVAESNLFDLYPTDINENYYKQVMQMYIKHKDTIYAVEHNNFTPSGNINPIKSAYENDGLIDTKLAPAKEYLVENYAQGVNIDGDVIVGQGIGQNSEAYADITGNINDSLQGTAKNDLIFGERGDDTLVGNGGNDVLIGGSGKDYLEGGVKESIKHIEVTTTNFTKTFIYCECESVTKWSDVESDEWIEEEEFYVDKATGTKYILNGSSLSVISSSGSITINNFSDGDLGINLSETESIDKKEISKEVFLKEDFCSPLVLDLNANGNTSEFIYNTDTHFDMDGDNLKERTAWIESGDGLLTLDSNQDGIVNNGSELFGNYSKLLDSRDATDGFNALSDYDKNSDGVIDAKDNVYNSLKVWQDINQDGITDEGELKTLSELGISSINLDATTVETQESRNNISHTSTFIQNGVELAINDVWFRKDSDDVTYEFNTTVSSEIEAMPELKGSGRVKNLSHAMSEDATLKSKVQTLLDSSATSNYNTLLSQTKDILTQWTHTDNISASQTRGDQQILNHNYANAQPRGWRYRIFAYARDITILESFAGREFTMYADGELTSDGEVYGHGGDDTLTDSSGHDTLYSGAENECFTSLTMFKKYTHIKNNINNYQNLYTHYKSLDIIKKHFYTPKDDLWYVIQNNRDYKMQREVA